MLMKPDRKNAATVIVSQDRSMPAPNKEGAEQDMSPAHMAAEELIAALEARDPQAVVEAFKALKELCEYEAEEPGA